MAHSQADPGYEDIPLIAVNPVKLRREAATFGRFATVGLLGAVIDFTVLNLLIFAVGWNTPMQMVLANLVSTSAAIVSNYFLNRRWTFKAQSGGAKQFFQFLAVSASGLILNALIFYVANQYIFGPLLHTGFAVQLAKASAIGVVMFWNFTINRIWTFRHAKAKPMSSTSATLDTAAVGSAASVSAAGVSAIATTASSTGDAAAAENPAAAAAQPGATEPDASGPRARGARFAALDRRRLLRWAVPLGVGLLLLAVLNAGLYLRLAGPKPAAAAPAQTDTSGSKPDLQNASQPAAEPVAAQADTSGSKPDLQNAGQPVTDVPAAGDVRFAAAFVDGTAPSAWRAFDGDWQVQDGTLVQLQPDGYDKGTVYAGVGANDGVFQDYVYTVRLKLLSGTGAGLYFNLPTPDGKNGGHMVRFTDDGKGVFWGSFDDAGAFAGQGFAGTAPPGTDWHTLAVRSGPDTYSITLDGALLAQDVPLVSKAGHIGLTTSQATAAFAAATVSDPASTVAAGAEATVSEPAAPTAVPTPAPTAPAATGATFSAISGDWQQEGSVIRQENSQATDFSIGAGVSAENYTLETDITLPTDPALADAGAGILFQMPARDSKNGAHMVRFVEGGKGLTWGRFAPDGEGAGTFTGDGYVELNLQPGEPQRLSLAVHDGTFDVLVNGASVVSDVPAATGPGWIGLIAFRGPVLFDNVKLSLGSVVK